jgi:RNA polymerase sigma-70 factor (ECF subfamily)
LVARVVGDPGAAEELAQDAFVKAFTHLDRYDPTRRFASWLFSIAHRTAIDHLRHSRIATLSIDEAGGAARVPDRDSPAALVERASLADALDRALGRLRPEYRAVMVLRYQEGLAYDEIAEVMDLPTGTVKTHIHRARKALAEDDTLRAWRENE